VTNTANTAAWTFKSDAWNDDSDCTFDATREGAETHAQNFANAGSFCAATSSDGQQG